MRRRPKGFSLVDCLTALAITLIGLGGALKIAVQSQRAYVRCQDLTVAWQLISHLQRLPPDRLAAFGERWYDFRGFPGESGDKYRVRVDIRETETMTEYRGVVAFEDEGEPRRLTFTRLDWGVADAGL